jgi:hypothetical protein
MKKEKSKIEKQREDLRNTLRETAKLHLIKNGYDNNLIKLNFRVTDEFKVDLVVLNKKTKEPTIIVNIDDPVFYDHDYDQPTANLQSLKFGWTDNHLLNYNGKKFEIIHRIFRPNNNTMDFIIELDENEIKELENITSQELFKIHREKHNLSCPIEVMDFNEMQLTHSNIHPLDFVNMLIVKYIDETKNNGKLFRGTHKINEEVISEISENLECFQENETVNYTNLNFDVIRGFNTPVGEWLRTCSISDSNPFELIKLISSFDNKFRNHNNNTISKEIISFISEIQNIEKNSVVLLDNLSFSTIFEHIFVIIEKLGCKLDELDKFVNLFIRSKDPVEHLKIKFIFQVLGINTENIKFNFSELNIETKIDYHISLKPFNLHFSGTPNESKLVGSQQQYGNDLSKYQIIDFINNVKSGTTMSFIVAPNILFNESKSAKLFRNELLKNTKILAIIQLPKNSLNTTPISPSLIILKKSSSKVSDYNIFMSDIDKTTIDFLFVKKEIIKKYNEFKNKKSIKNETDLGFSVNTSELKENWSLFDKKPSQKAITKSLKFSNPVPLQEVAEIIRPSSKDSKLEDIIRIRDLDHLFDLKMIVERIKSEEKSKNISNSSLFEPGDILFSISGTIGKTAKILSKIPNVGLSSGLVIIRPDKSKINSDYLKHVLDSKNTHLQLVPKGTAIQFLSTKQISDIKIELVKPEKQKVIVKKIVNLKAKIIDLQIKILEYQKDIENITTKKT